MLATILVMIATPIPPPKGVNDSILGTAEEHKVEGPARICFNEGAIDLKAGETAYLDYMGIHWAAIRILGPDGEFKVSEGNAWAEPRGGKRISATIRLFGGRTKPRYAVYGRTEYSPDQDRLLTWVDGMGNAVQDLALARRVIPVLQDKTTCHRRFMYGMFFDDEAAQP